MTTLIRIRCSRCLGDGNDWEWRPSIGEEVRVACHQCNGAGWLRLRDGVLERLTMEEVQADNPDTHEHEWVTRI